MAQLVAALVLLCGCCLRTTAQAEVSFVQGASSTLKDENVKASVTFRSTQSQGDLSVVFVAWADGNAQVVSVTDSNNNLYLRAGYVSQAEVASQAAYYCASIAAAVANTNTVKVVLSAPARQITLGISEYHGLDALHPLDVATSTTGDGQFADVGAAPTGNANELLVVGALSGSRMLGPAPGYRQRLLSDNGLFIVQDRIARVAQTPTASTFQTARLWQLTQILAFRSSQSAPIPRPPYPQSQLVRDMEWDFSTILSHRRAVGSDIWPTTWASDGNLYAAWGDGGGFDGSERSKASGRASLGFARISGTPGGSDAASYWGRNVWGQAPRFAEAQATFGGKVVDLISIGGILYAQGGLWTSANCHCRDPTVKGADSIERTLAWSKDLGRSWQVASWVSPIDLGSSLQFGRDYSGAFDPAHVYFFYQRDIRFDPTHIYLRRVRSTELTIDPITPGHFEYWSGVDSNGDPGWSTSESDATAVFYDSNSAVGVFASPNVVYDAPLKRYLLTVWHGASTGQIGFFESPNPWGPWATMAYYDDWGGFNESAGEATGLSVPSKWIGADGRTLWVIFSGVNNGADNEFDSLNLLRVTLR